MNGYEVLEQRGFIDNATRGELKKSLEQPVRFYVGFDPTADSLHLGNLMGIMAMAHLQRAGHTPVVLVGGATGLIGDPSGKSHERPLLTPEQVHHNLEGIKRDIAAILEVDHPTAAPIFVNNYDWYQGIGLIEFLRDVGKHCRMGPMLGKEMVRTRLASDEGLSYTEFSYQLLQGYDFVHLYDTHKVVLELGGSDQWGNITAGTELVRKLRGAAVDGLTWPLLTRSDGKKFGKSEGGAIWLSPDRLSPYDFYQYLVRVPDADVAKLMRLLTFIEMEEIEEWEKGEAEPHAAQKRLASAVTEIVHGANGLALAERVTASVAPGAKATALDAATLEAAAHEMGSTSLARDAFIGAKLLDLLVTVELVKSKGEGRRLIRNGGVYLNNEKIEDEGYTAQVSDLVEDSLLLLGVGKKKKLVIRVS